MHAERVTHWLTLSANIGVVIGLVMLLFELQQNGELVRAQIHQARADNYVANMMDLADTKFLLPAYKKLLDAGGVSDVSALDALDPIERERIRRYVQARMTGYDNLFYQFQRGYLDKEFYDSKVTTSIRKLAPLWVEFGLLDGGTPSFATEVARIAADDSAPR